MVEIEAGGDMLVAALAEALPPDQTTIRGASEALGADGALDDGEAPVDLADAVG